MRIEYSEGEGASNVSFELDSAKEAKLLAAIAETERGEIVNAADILLQICRS